MKLLKVIFLFLIIHSGSFAQDSDPYLKGLAEMIKGNLNAAIGKFTSALSQTGRKTDLYIMRADCYYQQGEYRKAINDLKLAEKTRKYPGSYLLAKSYAGLSMADSAIHYLQVHLQSGDKHPESYIKLDPAFSDLEKTREWVTLWKQDWYSEFEILLAEVNYLIKSEDYQDALDLADQSMEQYGYRHELHAARARVFISLGSQKAAISALSEAIERSNQTVSEYFIQRSEAYLAGDDREDALDDLSRAIMLEKDNFDLIRKRSILRNELGYHNEALRDIAHYIEYFAEDPEGFYIMGNIYAAKGNYLKSLEWYNKTLKINTERPEYFLARGNAYLNTKTYSYALSDYSMALDLDPRNREAYLNKGLVRYYLNDPEGACHDWNKAMEYGSFKAYEYLEKHCR